jgi:hypothetical protein
VSTPKPKRAPREAYAAAERIFAAEGFTCEMAWGGKHVLCVATRGLTEIRIPVAGTPSGGVTAAVKMAESTARRRLRRLPV